MIKIRDLEKEIKKIWINNVYDDCRNDIIWNEADLVASFYHHLKPFADKHDLGMLLEQDHIDLEIEDNNNKTIFAFEFSHRWKISNASTIKKIKKDINKLQNLKKEGIRRGYICYLNCSKEVRIKCDNCNRMPKIDKIKRNNKCPYCGKILSYKSFIDNSKWMRNYYRFLYGYCYKENNNYNDNTYKHWWGEFKA